MALSGLMKGKRGLVMGVANQHSIAWGIAQALHDVVAVDAVEMLEVGRVERVVHALQPVTRQLRDAARLLEVVPHQHVVSGQKRRGLGPKVGEDDAAEFLNLVSRVAKPLPKRAISRLTGHFQNLTSDIVQPTMIATAQAAILKMTELQRSPPVRAAQCEDAEPAAIVAEKHEIFS